MAHLSILWQAIQSEKKHASQQQKILLKCLPSTGLQVDTFVTLLSKETCKRMCQWVMGESVLRVVYQPGNFKLSVEHSCFFFIDFSARPHVITFNLTGSIRDEAGRNTADLSVAQVKNRPGTKIGSNKQDLNLQLVKRNASG